MLLYSLLHLTGYDLPLEELKRFRQWGSLTPGHPEYGLTPGVETTTGPLGQGFANGVGMAMAQAHVGAVFNKPGHQIVDHYVYGIVSDGDLMEGVAAESASLAGHLKLGRLIYLYDDNQISIEGSTDLTFTEDRLARFRAYGWHTQAVDDGNDLEAIDEAIRTAQSETERPSIIAVRTTIGYGSPNKAGTAGVHGEPLGEEEAQLTKKNLDWPLEPAFLIPEDVSHHFREALLKGEEEQNSWLAQLDAYTEEYPELAAELKRRLAGDLPRNWDADIPRFEPDPKGLATRSSGGAVLNAIAQCVPEMIGGSADLAPSTKTLIGGTGDFGPGAYGNRNLRFGVREHAMAGILNGMALYGGLRPFGATFMVFSDYARPSVRIASMMKLPIVYVFTHDSVGVGEDGPTHQPVEHVSVLRAIPGLTVIRPGDAKESVAAWRFIAANQEGPVALALTRQSIPTLEGTSEDPAQGLACGAYIVEDWPEEASESRIILIATGSELHLAVAAREELKTRGVAARVVSMPSRELFEAQADDYRDSILPRSVRSRLAIEAGVTMGWERYVGLEGEVIGLDRFGASAPYQEVMKNFGITVEDVVRRSLAIVSA
jgi:transketolase